MLGISVRHALLLLGHVAVAFARRLGRGCLRTRSMVSKNSEHCTLTFESVAPSVCALGDSFLLVLFFELDFVSLFSSPESDFSSDSSFLSSLLSSDLSSFSSESSFFSSSELASSASGLSSFFSSASSPASFSAGSSSAGSSAASSFAS